MRAREELFRAPQRLVEAAQGRTPIAGDKTRGVEAGGLVALALQDQQPHQRLHAGQVDAAGFERVLVIEADVAQRGREWGKGASCGSKNCVPGIGLPINGLWPFRGSGYFWQRILS